MARRRDYIEEILAKKTRHLKRADRLDQFERRVHPLVKGFRHILALGKHVDFRHEWLKYGAIGYIACVEGYFRMLIADIINLGKPYSDRVSGFKDIKFNIEDVVAIHSEKVSLGEYIAHLLPIKGVQDINHALSVLLDEDFFKTFQSFPTSEFNSTPYGEMFPHDIGAVEALFNLRHLYCHELAPKVPVQTRRIENLISSTATFVMHTEDIVQARCFPDA